MLNMFTFNFILNEKKPLLARKFELPSLPHNQIDWRLLTGSALFGVGWGLGGLCPGPGLINTFVLPSHVVPWMAACIVGQIGAFKVLGDSKPNPLLLDSL